jgi:hypothetical protein
MPKTPSLSQLMKPPDTPGGFRVHGPGKELWEVYTITGDSATYEADSAAVGSGS